MTTRPRGEHGETDKQINLLKYCGESKQKGSNIDQLLSRWCSKVCVSALCFPLIHYTLLWAESDCIYGIPKILKRYETCPWYFYTGFRIRPVVTTRISSKVMKCKNGNFILIHNSMCNILYFCILCKAILVLDHAQLRNKTAAKTNDYSCVCSKLCEM